ncbi:hypothetical protein ACFULT_26500 [Rhodococcus sp. NPDC057297]|uniref:hypothetical protein n=1 Tax=Rhodococcus sp. NPDC057297 TaxID=3346090 RepID=UPI0036428BD8
MRSIFTVRGTGNERGVFKGMTGAVAKKLDPNAFEFGECIYPATIGRIGSGQGNPPVDLDRCVEIGVQDLARQVKASKYPAGLISYSLGGIVVSRFLERVEAGEWLNDNGSKLQVDFVVNIANPARAPGDSVIPVMNGYGLHSSHGRWPANTVVLELANPNDIICSAARFSPARKIAGALSPFSALEQRKSDPFADLRKIQSEDWWARLTPGRYVEAAIGLGGYLLPNPRTGTTEHTLYSTAPIPGSHLTWTDWAAAEINRRWAR